MQKLSDKLSIMLCNQPGRKLNNELSNKSGRKLNNEIGNKLSRKLYNKLSNKTGSQVRRDADYECPLYEYVRKRKKNG
ncbi:MAG: hypothetical protein K6G11_07580 [Lachnospiraceae bacterium]|nr:hypothetical protein [Lachnospiraceae bacterium]